MLKRILPTANKMAKDWIGYECLYLNFLHRNLIDPEPGTLGQKVKQAVISEAKGHQRGYDWLYAHLYSLLDTV